VATMFTLLVILLFMQLTIVAVVPAQEYNAEWATSRAAIDAFERLRLATQLAAVDGSQFSIPIPLGTDAVSPFSTAKQGSLRFDPANGTSIAVSFQYVPKLFQATVTHIDQDVILAIDSSGSMVWNDPSRLRISSAQEYMRNLIPPDRVASIDFDDNAFFTRANIGGPAHFLNYPPNSQLMYVSPQADLNEPLMKTVTGNTGGTYYHAQTANDIRWVYYEISRRYLSAFVCGLKSTSDTSFGALELSLGATRYPAQTLRMEAGAINVRQGTSTTLWRGMPLSYRQTGDGLGLSATFPTLIGAPQIATGTGFETVEGRVIGRDLLTQSIQKAPLGDTSTDITTGRLDFEYWATQGAAKPAGVTAIRPPLINAANYAQWAQDNWTARDFVDAKFNADRSQAQLSIAITNINAQVAAGNVQNWLAFQTTDNVRLNGCRLNQWLYWYQGVTFRVTSANAPAYAVWFNETFRNVGAGVITAVVSGVAVVTIRAVDTLVVDRRLIEISFGS